MPVMMNANNAIYSLIILKETVDEADENIL